MSCCYSVVSFSFLFHSRARFMFHSIGVVCIRLSFIHETAILLFKFIALIWIARCTSASLILNGKKLICFLSKIDIFHRFVELIFWFSSSNSFYYKRKTLDYCKFTSNIKFGAYSSCRHHHIVVSDGNLKLCAVHTVCVCVCVCSVYEYVLKTWCFFFF